MIIHDINKAKPLEYRKSEFKYKLETLEPIINLPNYLDLQMQSSKQQILQQQQPYQPPSIKQHRVIPISSINESCEIQQSQQSPADYQDNIKENQQQQPQEANLQEQKDRLDALSNLLSMLHHKNGQNPNLDEQGQNRSQSSQSSKSSSQISSTNSIQQKEQTQYKATISQPVQEKEHLTASNIKPKAKSKFANHHQKFSPEEPYIITSSHKSFFTQKSNTNLNPLSLTPSSKFLSPGNINLTSNKEVTSFNSIDPNAQQLKSQVSFQNSPRSAQKTTTFSALPQVLSHQQPHSSGISLYEEVLAKNFQVIDNLLRKLNQIYSHQEEYETTITQISQKLHKLEVDNENIHHEFRTSHFMIDKKLNSITNEYSNILQDINLIKKMWSQGAGVHMGHYFPGMIQQNDEDGQGSSRKRRSGARKSGGLRKSGRGMRQARTSIFNANGQLSNVPLSTFSQHPNGEPIKGSPRNSQQRRSTRQSMMKKSRKSSNWMNLKGLDEQNLGKVLLEKINQSNSWQDSSQSEEDSEELLEDGSQRRQRRSNRNNDDYSESEEIIDKNGRRVSRYGTMPRKLKDSRKSYKKGSKNGRISIDSFDQEQLSGLKNEISQELIKMSHEKNEQLRKFTQLGIQTMMTKKCEFLEQKFQQKLFEFKKSLIEQTIEKEFRLSLTLQLQRKFQQSIQSSITLTKTQLSHSIGLLQKKVNKQIDRKCDKQQVRQDLKQILESMNRKVNTLMDQCYHKFAERGETKRAIIFLQKKINKLVETAQKFSFDAANIEASDNVKCLSCSKNLPTMGNHTHQHTASQPMFTQVHLVSPPERQQLLGMVKQFSMTARKSNTPNQSTQKSFKPKVKFMDITNYSSVNDIFQHPPQQQSSGMNKQSGMTIKPQQETSKELFMKKLKNGQTSESLHIPQQSGFANKSSKLVLNTQDRPNTGVATGEQIKFQKNWKQKATSMLKKQALMSGNGWRSKSTYKKA